MKREREEGVSKKVGLHKIRGVRNPLPTMSYDRLLLLNIPRNKIHCVATIYVNDLVLTH